jgi:hypothetical protein
MPAVESFLTLEDSLARRLIDKWTRIVEPMAKRMANDLMEGQANEAQAEIDKLNFSRIVRGETKFIRFHSLGSYLYGASNLTGAVDRVSAVQEGNVPEIIGPAERSFRAMIDDIDITLSASAADTIQKAAKLIAQWNDERQLRPVTKVEKADPLEQPPPVDIKEFEEFFGDDIVLYEITATQMKTFIDSYVQGRISKSGSAVVSAASSLHTSRLANYGFLTEAALFGVTKYRVSEQLDGRTCPVCRRMDGKVFDTADAYERLDGILRVEDQQALKQMSPWPKQTKAGIAELDRMSNRQLQERGFAFPPYHPKCRGVLLPVDGNPPPLA